MRVIIAILCLLITQEVFAIRLQPSFTMGVPLGAMSYKQTSSFFLGQTKSAVGGGLSVTMPIKVKRPFYVGVHTYVTEWKLDDVTKNYQLRRRYSNDGNYVTVNSAVFLYSLSFFGAELSYNKSLGFIEVEPVVRLGLGLAEFTGVGAKMHVKTKNDNYFETYSLNAERSTTFLYHSAGIKLYKGLATGFGLFMESSYCGGRINVEMLESKEDFLGNLYPENSFEVSQQISMLMFNIGFQLRFGTGEKLFNAKKSKEL